MPQKSMSPSGVTRPPQRFCGTPTTPSAGICVAPFGAEQQHYGLEIHASVGPLWSTQVAVDVAEEGGGRAETVPVRGSGPLARLHVLARDTEFAVTLLAEGGSALAVGGLQCGRVRLVFPLVPGVAGSHGFAGAFLELASGAPAST